VARESTGSVKDIGAGFIQRAVSVLRVEVLVASYSLDRVAQLEMTRIILKTDASNLRKALTTNLLDCGPEDALFRQIHEMMASNFISCFISICIRTFRPRSFEGERLQKLFPGERSLYKSPK
jgi:hypothetical protein